MRVPWFRVGASLAVGAILALNAIGTTPTHRQQNQTKGTAQMAGGLGQFGVTYTLTTTDQYGPVNFTLVSANYSVERVSMKPNENTAPSANQKLLIIHYRLKNPNKGDLYYSGRGLFQAVDSNNNLIDDIGESRRDSDIKVLDATMKPGQGLDDLFTCIILPAEANVTKLILKMGKPGTKEMVTRFQLATKPNLIKPLAAPFADPADKTGATALQTIPGTIGATYPAGLYDVSLASTFLAPGPIGNLTADDGNQFLVATVTATNKTTFALNFDGSLNFTLKTDDGKIVDFTAFKAKSDARFESQSLDPGESATMRCVIQVPKAASLKTLTVAEPVNNSLSRAYVYDVSGVK